jgi:hypothetical protein
LRPPEPGRALSCRAVIQTYTSAVHVFCLCGGLHAEHRHSSATASTFMIVRPAVTAPPPPPSVADRLGLIESTTLQANSRGTLAETVAPQRTTWRKRIHSPVYNTSWYGPGVAHASSVGASVSVLTSHLGPA